MRKLATALLTVLVTAIAHVALAQPRVEIAGGATAVHIDDGGDFWGTGLQHVGAELRITVSMSPRFALEWWTTYGKREITRPGAILLEGARIHRTEGLSVISIRQRLKTNTSSRFHAFATYGVAGFFGTTSYDAGRVKDPHGYVYSVPASQYKRDIGLQFLTVGFAVVQDLGSHVALRGDVQVIDFLLFPPVGAHASASIVIGFGG